MKDSEFTELLNLYLDHEISPADAARLEAEVQSNPARRRTYQEYCRMQKACKLLAQDFATASDQPDTRKIVAFEAAGATRRRRQIAFGSTFAAAAACVALVFVSGRGGNDEANTAADPLVQATPEQANAPVVIPAAQPDLVAAAGEVVTPQAPLSLGNPAANGLTISGNAQIDPRLAWLRTVQLEPMQLQVPMELRFDPASMQRFEDRTLTIGSKQAPSEVLQTAIRFQK